MEEHAVTVDCDKRMLKFRGQGIEVEVKAVNAVPVEFILSNSMSFVKNMADSALVFAASMYDIEKALCVKASIDPREILPEYLIPLVEAFEPKNADT